MIDQYRYYEKKYPDRFVLMRIGDFYEAFGETAEKLARICDRVLAKVNDVPISGFPWHARRTYVRELTEAGERVALVTRKGDDHDVEFFE